MSLTAKPQDYQYLFLDMNSFFASVEQQVRPDLRGCPVGVTPYLGPSGCIIAASYEAKKYGIKICRVREAKKILPSIKIIESRPSLYMIYHKEIKKVIEKFTPFFEVKSIDEFALRLTPQDQNEKNAIKLAQKLKETIKRDVGDYLSCSVGIGPSKFLAKMAAEYKKPDGLTVLKLNDLENFYREIKLTDLTGINLRTEAKLNHFGISSPTELYQSSLGILIQKFSHFGRLWYYRLRGYEVDDTNSVTKTIGHSHVLEPELRDKNAAISVLQKLVFKSGYRLRHENFFAGGVYLNIGFTNSTRFSQSKKYSQPFSDNQTFWHHVLEILTQCPWQGQPIYLAVGTFNLHKNENKQISIFEEIEKRENLVVAIDKINDEYGAETVFPATMMRAGQSAPDRIPFGRPRYEILHQ